MFLVIIYSVVLIVLGLLIRFTDHKTRLIPLIISALIIGFLSLLFLLYLPQILGMRPLQEGNLLETLMGSDSVNFLMKNRLLSLIIGFTLLITFLYNLLAISPKGDGEEGVKIGLGLILLPVLLAGVVTSNYHIPHIVLLTSILLYILLNERSDERGLEIGAEIKTLYFLFIGVIVAVFLSFVFRLVAGIEEGVAFSWGIFSVLSFLFDILALILALFIPVLSHWPGRRIDHAPNPTFSFPIGFLFATLPLIMIFKWQRLYDVNGISLLVFGLLITTSLSVMVKNERNQFRTSLSVFLNSLGFILIGFAGGGMLGNLGALLIAFNILFFGPMLLYVVRRSFACQRLLGGTGLEGMARGLPRGGVFAWWSFLGLTLFPPSLGFIGLLLVEISVIRQFGFVVGLIPIIPYILHLVVIFELSRRTFRGKQSFDEPDTTDFSALETISSTLICLVNISLFVLFILKSNLIIDIFG